MSQALDAGTQVAVIGAGTMGMGIAQVAAQAGHQVYIHDTRANAASAAIDKIKAGLAKLVDKGYVEPAAASATGARLVVADSLADIAGVGLVIEAIAESLEAKQGLFQQLEEIVKPQCIFATNTSSIPVTAIGSALQQPGRLLGMHFFNPATRMRLVEVVSGLDTNQDVAAQIYDLSLAWGKTPVHAKSTPGFIVNRVARPFYAEALRLIQEQAGDPATLDHLMRTCGGFRMGPFELMDLIGHDINYTVTNTVWQAFYQDSRFLPSLVQRELVDAGRLGRKTGQGFYDHRPGAQAPQARLEPAATTTAAGAICIYGSTPLAQALAQGLSAKGLDFLQQQAQADGRVASAGDAYIYPSDGRTATARAADNTQPNTFLLDLALDYSKSSTLALASARQASPQARDNAVACLQAAGYDVASVGDVPGMLVLRTVAMLANEAADAVYQGVCSSQDVDLAMQLGVNYPQGPLAWANQVGVKHIATALSNIGAHYGEERYRVSPYIRQAIYSAADL